MVYVGLGKPQLGPLLRVSQDCREDVGQVAFLSGAYEVFGRIHFLAAVELMVVFFFKDSNNESSVLRDWAQGSLF